MVISRTFTAVASVSFASSSTEVFTSATEAETSCVAAPELIMASFTAAMLVRILENSADSSSLMAERVLAESLMLPDSSEILRMMPLLLRYISFKAWDISPSSSDLVISSSLMVKFPEESSSAKS